MSSDPFDQLAAGAVPPVPPDFDWHLHHRVNHWLLVVHLVDFVARAIPEAGHYFAQGVLGWLELTVTGRTRTRGEQSTNPE